MQINEKIAYNLFKLLTKYIHLKENNKYIYDYNCFIFIKKLCSTKIH